MNIFDIKEIRKIIFGYIYPSKITKGMKIKIIETKFHPFLKDREDYIYDIKNSLKNKEKVITLMNESKQELFYRVYTYIYPSLGDKFKVIKY
jgi:hypothetical protein